LAIVATRGAMEKHARASPPLETLGDASIPRRHRALTGRRRLRAAVPRMRRARPAPPPRETRRRVRTVVL